MAWYILFCRNASVSEAGVVLLNGPELGFQQLIRLFPGKLKAMCHKQDCKTMGIYPYVTVERFGLRTAVSGIFHKRINYKFKGFIQTSACIGRENDSRF